MRISGYPDLRSASGKNRVGCSLGEHTGDKLYLIFIHVFSFIIASYNSTKNLYIFFFKRLWVCIYNTYESCNSFLKFGIHIILINKKFVNLLKSGKVYFIFDY